MCDKLTALLLLFLAIPTPLCGSQPLIPETPPPSLGKLEVREIPIGRMISSRDDIQVSPDQRRVAFKVKKGEKEVVVIDGKEGQSYDLVRWGPFFSPDSQRVAFTATRNGLQFIVVDGVEEKDTNRGTICTPSLAQIPSELPTWRVAEMTR